MNWLEWLKLGLEIARFAAIVGFAFSLGALYGVRDARRAVDEALRARKGDP